MIETKSIIEVKEQVSKFREMFKDNPKKQIEEGTWFVKILQMVLTEHSTKVNGVYFKKKYIGLDNERIAYQLIKTTANYTAITGGLAAVAISAAELSTVVTGGASLAALAASLIGEISYISYLQLKLVYEISVVLDARLDKDDPEDILTIFWCALGINIWEDVTNSVLRVGPRGAEYLGRKALRSGIRKTLTNLATKVGGTKLAQKITEKALLKLLVPGVNIPIAALVNKKFTKVLGYKALKSLKSRGVTIRTVDKLSRHERYYQILTIPLIFQIGISNEDKGQASRNIEMQNNVARRFQIQDNEEQIIDDLVDLEFNEFCEILSDVDNQEVARYLFDIAIYAYLLSKNKNQDKLLEISKSLDIDFKNINLDKYKKHSL